MKPIYIVLKPHGIFAMKVALEDADRLLKAFPGQGPCTIVGVKSTPTGSVHVELKFLLEDVAALEVAL